jgi:glycerate 2-kinase
VRVLVAPDKFKGTLTAAEAAGAIATGWRRARPDDDVDVLPMADGGEGTLDALVAALDGERRVATVTGPLGDPVAASYGVADAGRDRLGVVEMAQASGLQLVAPGRRDPMVATTFGTGELIAAACREPVDEVLVAVGGSATNDGGAGVAQALGVRLLDGRGEPIRRGAIGLLDLAGIDVSTLDRVVAGTRVAVAADVDNPLTGPLGAAAVFAPQKGASSEDVQVLDRALAHLAAVVERDLGIDVRTLPGAGAAGGLGAGLAAFVGARIRRGADLVMDVVGFERRLAQADVVVTGEGRLDRSSLRGKVPSAVVERAGPARTPAVVLCGEARVSLRGAVVRSLVEAVGEEAALEQPRRSLEDLASRVAAEIERLSSGR